MTAAVYYGKRDIRVEDRPVPKLEEDEILLKIHAVAICGTDLRIYNSGHFKIPEGAGRILGHELAGEIVEIGKNVNGLELGMRIAVAPNVGCGVCEQCVQGLNNYCKYYEAFGISLDGGFAEFMRVPGNAIENGNVVCIPDNLSYEEAALAEPLSCCYHGITSCNISPGDIVVVIGAGPIGNLHVQLARLSGAGRLIVSDFNTERFNMAMMSGADLCVNPRDQDLVEFVYNNSDSKGADVVIVAASSRKAQEQSVELLNQGGRVNFFGGLPKEDQNITINSNLIHYKRLQLTGTTGSTNYSYKQAFKLLEQKRIHVDKLIEKQYPLSRIHEALKTASEGNALKVLLKP